MEATYPLALLPPCPPVSAKWSYGANVSLVLQSAGVVMLSKSDTGYHIAEQHQDHCAECKWFKKPKACRWVEGNISPQGWCYLYHRGSVSGVKLASKEQSNRSYVREMRAG